MKPIEREFLEKLTHEQLITMTMQQQTQCQLQDQIMQMQEARIKELETEVAYLENMVANQRSVKSQGESA